MFVPLLAVPLAVQMIAAAGALPKLDVTASCRGAAEAGYATTTRERLQNCIDSEHRTRDQLDKNWSSFPVANRQATTPEGRYLAMVEVSTKR